MVGSASSPIPSTTLWHRFKAWILVQLFKWHHRTPVILTHPDKRLKRVAEYVNFDTMKKKELVRIVRRMHSALVSQGYGMKLGIAAPQIGINKRIMIVRGVVIVNPEWHPTKAPPNEVMEGCYSVPNRQFKVSRAQYGWAKWYSIDGVYREYRIKGLEAIVFQHELDHLDGKCCVDVGKEMYRTES